MQPKTKTKVANQVAVSALCSSQNDLLRRSKTGDLQRTPPVSLAPPFLCPRNRFPNPILHNLSFLRPFSSLRISQTWLRAGLKKPVPKAKAETAWGGGGWGIHASFRPACRREAELCAKARRLQGPGDARRRLSREETRAHAAMEAARRAPGSQRHSPGRSRAGCSDTECGPGRSRPRRRRPGRSAEP